MPKATHYNALGLAPTAPPEVIRAAYKALCLISHPDKTLHLSPGERASHATSFRDIQEAYDVLSIPSIKAAYDARLASRESNPGTQSTKTHSSTAFKSDENTVPKHTRKTLVKLTTPEEKAALRAKAHQSFETLREQRAKRSAEEDRAGTPSLKDLLHIWTEIAEENRSDPVMLAHCTIRMHEYGQKIKEREQQHEEWLANMALAKRTPPNPSSKYRNPVPHASRAARAFLSTPSARSLDICVARESYKARQATAFTHPGHVSSAEKRRLVECEQAATAAARMEAHTLAKSRREVARQTNSNGRLPSSAQIRQNSELA